MIHHVDLSLFKIITRGGRDRSRRKVLGHGRETPRVKAKPCPSANVSRRRFMREGGGARCQGKRKKALAESIGEKSAV